MRCGWTDRMQHGTDNGYTNGECRCAPCRHAAEFPGIHTPILLSRYERSRQLALA